MDASQYPGYPSNYWYPQSHSAAHYANTYPSGTDMQPPYNPQAVPGGYPNGHGVYSPGQGHYSASGFHPSNPFYCADQMQQRPTAGPYPNQGGPPEQTAAGASQPHPQHQHHHYPGSHCQAGPGYSAGSYPHYNEGAHPMPPTPPYPAGQSLHPRPQAEAWAHSSAYGPSPQPWQAGQQPGQQPGQQAVQQPGQQLPQNHYGNPVRPQHPPAWPGTGTGAPPPYQPKDHQHQNALPVGPKPAPPPTATQPAEFSSPPQIYHRTARGCATDPNSSPSQPPRSAPSPAPPPTSQTHGPVGGTQPGGDNPGLARVYQIMVRVLLLQEDVDEFVGRKTDKTYRYLEELLTKELLELDSVETQGQEAVRQARKEAVQRIQSILEQLEKKAF